MSNMKELVARIEEIRKYMNILIKEKQDFLDSEVLAASIMLDKALDEYYKILNQKQKK